MSGYELTAKEVDQFLGFRALQALISSIGNLPVYIVEACHWTDSTPSVIFTRKLRYRL